MEDKCEERILSFGELLKTHKVEIPIIQRDYAQGRAENSDILIRFLNALKTSIINETVIKLDFIYGNIIDENFQPLDGQQRLTTLFLLHWYAANKCNVAVATRNELLSKFTYETRISSREFCNALVNNSLEITNAPSKLSDIIINSNWFFLSWKKDPTISSMLNAIDEIHRLFFEIDSLWDKLIKDNLITFYYVELENIGLTDDLYIKMNARGKLLTPFENLKAGLQKESTDNKWETQIFILNRFSFKIDTVWTDYFWSHFKKNNSVDSAHMRFITAIIMNRIVIEKSALKADERFQLMQRLNDNSDYVMPCHFTKESYLYLYKCYEVYCTTKDINDKLKLNFPLWRHQPKNSIISEIIYEDNVHSLTQSDSSYTLKVLFYAQTEFLLRNESFSQTTFHEWMRVIRNIISRGDIDKDGKRPDIIRSPQTFYGVINLINELAEGCNDIYTYLSNNTIKSTFAKEQIEEEQIKAKLIKNNPNIKDLLWKIEDNELLRGRINFVLYCIDYDKNSQKLNLELLSRIQLVFEQYFNKESDIPAELRRAFLTIEVDGKYEFYNYWWSMWNVINATKRKLLDKYRELEYLLYSDQKLYFKKIVLLLVQKDLTKIVDDFNPPDTMPSWKVKLISDRSILNYNISNYIAIPDDNSCCYLLKSKRPRDMDGCTMIK
jgi:hypothetical protein